MLNSKLKKRALGVYHNVLDKAHHYSDDTIDKTKQAAHIAMDYAHHANEEYTKVQKKLIRYTRHQPLKALGLALLAGYLISKII